MRYCTGPQAQSALAIESCAVADAAIARAAVAAISNVRSFICFPRKESAAFKQPLLLVEFLHLVVELVHLIVELLLFEDALADKQRCDAVQENAVLHDHLFELLVVVGAVVG